MLSGINTIKDAFELLAYIVASGALVTFWIYRANERRARDYAYFDACDQQYREFLMLSMQYPSLDVSWYKLGSGLID